MKTALRFVLIAAFSLAAVSAAKAQDSWVGKTIVLKKAGIKIHRTGDDGKRVYVVELKDLYYKVLGDKDGSLQVDDRRANIGWFNKADAVLLENAVEFFTERIRKNGKDADAYNTRAVVWKLKGELDNAIKDYTELLRLDSRAYAYGNRANAWYAKGDYEKSITDYNEAIRMEPNALRYHNRGGALSLTQEYDKAIADYTEAIRLDPKYVSAFSRRGVAWSEKKEYDKAIADYTEAIRLDPKFVFAYHNRGVAWSDRRNTTKQLRITTKRSDSIRNT